MTAYGMLVSQAIGDAYGAAFENVDLKMIQAKNNLVYHKHPKWNIGNGRYTDDTQMTLGLAEFILSGKPRTPGNLAQHFVRVYQRDPRPGYMPGFRNLLVNMTDGSDFLNTILPHSKRSGGAMRTCVAGLEKDRRDAIDLAMFQASLTHATKQGMDSAAAAALLAWLCRNGCPRDKLGTTIKAYIPGYPWDEPWKWWVKVDAVPVVRAAIWAVSQSKSMKKILRVCIAFGGDTDTVSAVAMPAAAMHPEIRQDLPKKLYDGLENGLYGRDYIEKLDWLLLDHFGIEHPHGKQPPDDLNITPPSDNLDSVLDLF